eukprot:TRINITY_DN22412_c0_g1_i1.p1 TRINITY_DN22412_c0_g1~~TRINITY_DN22412_c0_g1_i1.p1  ORF type:complete len:481 (+),score=119.87 TRINITY_DN22412_c0_g1_i1:43-1443(+)
MSAPTPFVSNVKQFSQHTKLDKMNGIPTVRPLKQPVRAINGDTPEVRSIYVNERMKELGVRCMEQFSVENTVAVGGVSQDAQKHLVRVKNMDKDDVNWVRVEGCKEKYGVSDVTLDRRATPYSMYPGKVFGLTGEFKYHGQGTIKGVRVTNPTPLMSSGAKKEADFAEAMHAKKKPRTEGTAPANESSFKMMVAAGPFDQSLSKSLQYVKRLIHHSNARGTGALLIVGPLSLERDSDDVGFLEEDDTLSYFPEELKGKKPQLIFVPSLDDPFNEYVYPQPGYTFDSTEGVFSLNNPGRFNINGVDVAVTSLDVLKALRQDMTHNVGSDTNVGVFSPYDASDPTSMKPAQKMALDEILAAGSLYPSLPPNSSVPLDVSLAEHLTFTSSTPDVLILPALQPFAEAVILNERDRTDKVVALNPGNFTSPVNRNKHQFMEVTVTRVPNQKKPIWEQVSVEWLDLEALDKK